MKKNRLVWIDVAKGLATLSVLIGHVSYFLNGYPSLLLHPILWKQLMMPFYWFYCIIGITAVFTFERVQQQSNKSFWYTALVYWKKKVGSLLLIYILASVYSYWLLPSYTFTMYSFEDFLFHILRFSVAPLHHFFLTLLQFYFVTPFIFFIVKRMKTIQIYLMSTVIVAIACIPLSTIMYYPFFAQVRPLIFGGWAFLLFYLGVGYSCFPSDFKKIKLWMIGLGLFFIEYLFIKNNSLIEININFIIVLWSFFTLLAMKMVVRSGPLTILWNFFSWIGVHSLSIYMFHWSILETITHRYGEERFQSLLGFTLLVGIGILFLISLYICITLCISLMKKWVGNKYIGSV